MFYEGDHPRTGLDKQIYVANDDAIAMPGRLHCSPENSGWRYHTYLWSKLAPEKSLTLQALPDKAAHWLRWLQKNSGVLFGYENLIYGDSNAGNWGEEKR